MEFKVYLFVFTLILMFTQSMSAPSGSDDEYVVKPTKEMEALYEKLLEEMGKNPEENSITNKISYAVDRIGGGNLI